MHYLVLEAQSAHDIQAQINKNAVVEGLEPSVNCDLEREPDAQPGE